LSPRSRGGSAKLRSLAYLLMLALVATGCDDSLTELLVVVDTDLSVPSELDHVRITVTAPDGQVSVAEGPIGDLSALPATVGLIHKGGEFGDVRVVAEGLLGGTVVVRREAVATFVHKQVRVLRLDLLRRCVGEACGAGMTCAEAGCRSERVAGSELPRYDGTIGSDGGVLVDASLDGGDTDAGPTDAGPPDAGPADAGPVCTGLPAQCGTGPMDTCTCLGCACGVTCDPSNCSIECWDAAQCTTSARSAGTVALRCRRSECHLDASGSMDVDVTCEMESSCDVDCSGAETCEVACRMMSQCVLQCAGATTCNMTGCTPTTCPGGEIVCGRDCP